MEKDSTKTCTNCKREIPADNFVIHSVHCARNIKLCPVCKEPVPVAELNEHQEQSHKPLPCKKCGESVCGTDLEDHIRDSCALTVCSCRHCDLELPRRELPLHEAYCGARTELCDDCGKWVMIKYKQVHIDTNHGFLKLDDDPDPVLRNEGSANTRQNPGAATSSGRNLNDNLNKYIKNHRNEVPKTVIRYFNNPQSCTEMVSQRKSQNSTEPGCSNQSSRSAINRLTQLEHAPVKRTNDQPQINTCAPETSKINKNLSSVSQGAVKKGSVKKQAPREPPISDPMRELAYWSALARSQKEEKQRAEQTAYNLSVGLQPVLSPAEKLEKLRKMDRLQNMEFSNEGSKNKLQGKVWTNGTNSEVARQNVPETCRTDLSNIKPMSLTEFMNRIRDLQCDDENDSRSIPESRTTDRFSDIKKNLRELRRGLNEVTAPYNNTSTSVSPVMERRSPGLNEASVPLPSPENSEPTEIHIAEDQLPCEFCGELYHAEDLVLHQTGCRPDLTQCMVQSNTPDISDVEDDSVIPCEFCPVSLPLDLISEHQERCRRGQDMLLFPD